MTTYLLLNGIIKEEHDLKGNQMKDFGELIFLSIFSILIFLSAWLTYGSPDITDGVIHFLMK